VTPEVKPEVKHRGSVCVFLRTPEWRREARRVDGSTFPQPDENKEDESLKQATPPFLSMSHAARFEKRPPTTGRTKGSELLAWVNHLGCVCFCVSVRVGVCVCVCVWEGRGVSRGGVSQQKRAERIV